MENREEKIKKLKDYFEKNDDTIMAFLFGSQAKKQERLSSDWDIGVYFKEPRTPLLWQESDKEYQAENKIRSDCIDILKTDNIDLIVLNRAPAAVVDVAIGGLPLVIKDRRIFLEFMLLVTSAARDFRRLTEDYVKIFWRSASLAPEDVYALNRRIMFIEEEMTFLADYINLSWPEYQSDRSKQRIVERSIEKLMNAIIDVSKTILASQRKTIPESYRNIIREAGLIPPFSFEQMEKISKWTELRNILAHEYLDYRFREIGDFLKNHGLLLKSFIELVKQYISENKV